MDEFIPVIIYLFIYFAVLLSQNMDAFSSMSKRYL